VKVLITGAIGQRNEPHQRPERFRRNRTARRQSGMIGDQDESGFSMPLHNCDFNCSNDRHTQVVRAHKHFTIDLHAHLLTPAVEPLVAGCPQKKGEPEFMLRTQGAASVAHNMQKMLPTAFRKMTSLDERLRDMDAMGVDVQALSPSPNQYYYWAEHDLAREIVRVQNEHVAATCAAHAERFVGLGTIALQHPELSVEQLTHAVKTLGLRGLEISTAVNGLDLADAKFERFWAKADELGCVVFIHPLGTSLVERVNQFYLTNIIGQPLETTIALSNLIFGGVLDRHHGVKIVAAHGGGYLPAYIGRSDHGYKVRPEAGDIQKKPSEYLKQIYFDSLVYSPEQLRALIAQVGASQIAVGTDYAFDMGDYDVHELLESVPHLSEEERAQISGGNAMKLLGIER
jgi:aminocarboxymuconate-semialdehyde decarboxylase